MDVSVRAQFRLLKQRAPPQHRSLNKTVVYFSLWGIPYGGGVNALRGWGEFPLEQKIAAPPPAHGYLNSSKGHRKGRQEHLLLPGPWPGVPHTTSICIPLTRIWLPALLAIKEADVNPLVGALMENYQPLPPWSQRQRYTINQSK